MSNHSSVHWNAWVWIQEQSWFQDPFLHIFYWEKTERFFLSVMLFSGFYYLICLLKNRMTDNIIMIRNKPKLKISRYSIPVPILFPFLLYNKLLFIFIHVKKHAQNMNLHSFHTGGFFAGKRKKMKSWYNFSCYRF